MKKRRTIENVKNDVLLLGRFVKVVRREVGRALVKRPRSAFSSVLPVATSRLYVVVVVVRTVFHLVRTAVGSAHVRSSVPSTISCNVGTNSYIS